jgi:hypothetical protein
MRSVQGLPGLSELPGFQSTTNQNKIVNTGELLITITPHVVRESGLRIASRPLLLPYNPNPSTSTFVPEEARPPEAAPQGPQPARPTQLPNGTPPPNGIPPNAVPPHNVAPPAGTLPTSPLQ